MNLLSIGLIPLLTIKSSAMNEIFQNKCISQLLYSNNSIISNQIDFNNIINDEIDYLSHNNRSIKDAKSRRVDSYAILIKYFTHRQHSHIHKLIDRLPILIEVATTTGCSTERRLMIQLMEVLLNDRNLDVVNLFSNVLSKLISVIHRICNRPAVKEMYMNFILYVLLLLGKSNIRPMLTPHVKTIRQICFDFISSTSLTVVATNSNNHNVSSYIEDDNNHDDDNDDNNINNQFKLVASVLAVYVSMESSESWSSTWSQLCSDGLTILVMLGVAKQSHQAGTVARETESSSISISTTHEQLLLIKSPVFFNLRGLKKVVVMYEAFKAICSVLKQV